MQYIDNSKILFILNPNSGKGNLSYVIRSIRKIDPKIFYIITSTIEEVKEVFDKYIQKFTVFVIVGGDGSINASIKYLINRPNKYLSVYPNGSGNGFARELGFKRNIKSLVKSINKGDLMDLDILNINDLLCINTSGVGIDSYVAHAFNRTKYRGLSNYILLTAKSFFTFKSFQATITSKDFKTQGSYKLITIANTRQFGNNAIIAPNAKPNDGLVELVLIKQFPFYLYPIFIIQLFFGLLKKSSYIDFITTNNPILIDSEYKEFHIDGEPIVFKYPIKVHIETKKIKIIKTKYNKINSLQSA